MFTKEYESATSVLGRGYQNDSLYLELIANQKPRGQTPYQAWYGKKPGVKNLRTFGCAAYAKIVGLGTRKMTSRSVRGIFLGYEPGSKAYRVYDLVTDKLLVTCDVVFDEQRLWNWRGDNNGATPDAEEVVASHMF